jgi:shikimate kinase
MGGMTERSASEQHLIDDYLRARTKIIRLLRVAHEAIQLSDNIGEFNGPVNGTGALDDAILAIYGDRQGSAMQRWTDTKVRVRAELRAMEDL